MKCMQCGKIGRCGYDASHKRLVCVECLNATRRDPRLEMIGQRRYWVNWNGGGALPVTVTAVKGVWVVVEDDMGRTHRVRGHNLSR